MLNHGQAERILGSCLHLFHGSVFIHIILVSSTFRLILGFFFSWFICHWKFQLTGTGMLQLPFTSMLLEKLRSFALMYGSVGTSCLWWSRLWSNYRQHKIPHEIHFLDWSFELCLSWSRHWRFSITNLIFCLFLFAGFRWKRSSSFRTSWLSCHSVLLEHWYPLLSLQLVCSRNLLDACF